jgi:hypothetical protein
MYVQDHAALRYLVYSLASNSPPPPPLPRCPVHPLCIPYLNRQLGDTALDLARREGHSAIVALLVGAEASDLHPRRQQKHCTHCMQGTQGTQLGLVCTHSSPSLHRCFIPRARLELRACSVVVVAAVAVAAAAAAAVGTRPQKWDCRLRTGARPARTTPRCSSSA